MPHGPPSTCCRPYGWYPAKNSPCFQASGSTFGPTMVISCSAASALSGSPRRGGGAAPSAPAVAGRESLEGPKNFLGSSSSAALCIGLERRVGDAEGQNPCLCCS